MDDQPLLWVLRDELKLVGTKVLQLVGDAAANLTPVTAALARLAASETFCTVAGEAIQLHGGIAITWEHDMHLYFKRAHSSAQLFGPPREQLRRLEAEVL